jgi:hypothetical protein
LYQEQKRRVAETIHRSPDNLGPTLLFGAASQVTSRAGILSNLPSRYICGLLVTRFFDTLEPALYIIHPPAFYKQYEEHWKNPDNTPIEWIALLFATMRIALHTFHRVDDEPVELQGKGLHMATLFRSQVAGCLSLVDCTQTDDHVIETLIYHLYSEYASFQDANSNVWVLLGTIIRLAMRLGYHRSSQNLPHISPFQVGSALFYMVLIG